MSWVNILASPVYCGFMLFNMIPLKEGEFLNFDSSVPPRKAGGVEISHFQTDCLNSPLRARVPLQVMTDDNIANIIKRNRCCIKKNKAKWTGCLLSCPKKCA